jgi:hypothetical protein
MRHLEGGLNYLAVAISIFYGKLIDNDIDTLFNIKLCLLDPFRPIDICQNLLYRQNPKLRTLVLDFGFFGNDVKC